MALSCMRSIFLPTTASEAARRYPFATISHPPRSKPLSQAGSGRDTTGLFLFMTEGSRPHGANRPCHRSGRFGWEITAQVLRPRVRRRLAE